MIFFLKLLLTNHKQIIPIVCPTEHWTQSTYKLPFPVGQAYVRIMMKLDELMHELIWITYPYLTIEL